MHCSMKIETERETDGRYIADLPSIPGSLAYSETLEEAIANVQALVLSLHH